METTQPLNKKFDPGKLIKWGISVGVPLMLLLIPVNEAFTAQARLFLVLSIMAILIIAFDLVNMLIPSILLPTAYVVLGVVEQKVAFQGFSTPTLIEAFGDCALRAKKAGFDGVEIHGAHGYLINTFVSAFSNKRTDLPELVKKFCTCYPEVRIMLLEKDPQSIYQILRDETGTASRIGFVTAPSTGEGLVQEFLPNEHYRFAPISRGRYRAIISHGSPLSKHKQICVKTLLKQPIVLLSSNETNNTPLWHWLKQYGEPHIALSTSSLNLWLNAIAENIGVGFLHDTTILVRDFLASTHMDNITDIAIKEHLDVLTGCLLPQEPCDIVMAFEQFLPRFTDPKRIRTRKADGE